MIIYFTKQTVDRYKIELNDKNAKNSESLTSKNEASNELFKWGAKLFYFDGRKSIQLVNFASRLTIFLFDIKVKDFNDIPIMLANYLMLIFEDKLEVHDLLSKYFDEGKEFYFDRLKDRSVISTINYTQSAFEEVDMFYEYLEDGVLKTIELNRWVNFNYLFGLKINGKRDYIISSERFEELLRERYLGN